MLETYHSVRCQRSFPDDLMECAQGRTHGTDLVSQGRSEFLEMIFLDALKHLKFSRIIKRFTTQHIA